MTDSFHLTELEKIETLSKGIFRGNMRKKIAMTIRYFDADVKKIKTTTNKKEKQILINDILEIAKHLRHDALASGASGYSSPKWQPRQ